MKKILIIYDYTSVRELITEELAAEGHLVVPIGKAALAKEVIGFLRPDLVLLDFRINGKDRWDVLEEIKKQDRYLRVLVLTTCDLFKRDLLRSLDDVYVIKNFHFDGLRQKVAEVLQRKPIHAGELKRSENLQTSDNNLNRLPPIFARP
jgi:two-component system response regulator AdeR